MNREIKFRAWCPKNKEMYYDDGNYRFHIFQDCIGYYPEYNKEEFYHFNTNPSKDELKIDVMQYVGLKDMADKDVYEGDILDDNWQIHFYRGMFVAVQCGKIPNMDNSHQIFWVLSNDHRVIGNIYENPDLLQ